MILYCGEIEDDDLRKSYTNFVNKMGDRRMRDRILKDATGELRISAVQFDNDPYLINCLKYFLLENNASMSKKNKDIITKIMGVEPVFIDSIDFSAQNRKRLYWTNIPVKEWSPKHFSIKDIAEPVEDKIDYDITDKVEKYLSSEYDGRKIQKNVRAKIKTFDETSKCLGCFCGDYGNNTGLIIDHGDGKF